MHTPPPRHRKPLLIALSVLVIGAILVAAVLSRIWFTTITWKRVRYGDTNYVAYVTEESNYLYGHVDSGYLFFGGHTTFALAPNRKTGEKIKTRIDYDAPNGVIRFTVGDEETLFDLDSGSIAPNDSRA